MYNKSLEFTCPSLTWYNVRNVFKDFALLKKRELIRAGIDPSKLLIATVLDRKRNAHAVLVYRSSQGDLVLDNLTNRIKPWSVTRYLFLRMQDPRQPRNWVGVYLQS